MSSEATVAATAASVRQRLLSDRGIVLVSLLALAAAAWAILAWQSSLVDGDMSLTMGMGFPLFIAVWAAMMVAIMYPTAAPMILTFTKVHAGRRDRGQSFVPTWVFAGAYILLWSATGVIAYAAAVAGDRLADESRWVMDNAPRLGGGLLIAAGVYQLTPLKEKCLSRCRSPMSFVMNSWRDGYSGAFRMGLEHGGYCLGCCWLLFAILFPLGMMNIAVLALVTVLIFAEKLLPVGRQVAYAAGAALVVYGAVVMVEPDALPMTMDSSAHEMEMDAAPMEDHTTNGEMQMEGEAPAMDQMPGMEAGGD